MNINQFLKKVNKTKTDLANEIGISRPTLNLYIELFESGKPIENDRYNIIFNRLFSNPDMDKEQFESQLESVRFLLERDKKYDIGILTPDAADIVANIHNKMILDMGKDEWDKKVYEAISIILSQYRIQPLMRELMSYYSDLYSDSNLENLSAKSKAYYSFLYKMFREITEKAPRFNAAEYEMFKIRKKEIADERTLRNSKKTESIKKLINKIIKEVEFEYQKDGIEASESEILSEVVRRVDRQLGTFTLTSVSTSPDPPSHPS